ncbi:MAG: DUF2325 domain-containing protein [Campylobacterota bacterium]
MSVLVIGADRISAIKSVLKEFGAQNIKHWDGRNKRALCKRSIPEGTQCVVMLTDFLNHNAMHQFKKQAKEKNIPFVCAKRSCSSLQCQMCKIFGHKPCKNWVQ